MTSPPKLRPGEFAFALVLLALSLIAFHQAYGISGIEGLATAGVMPMLAAVIMITSGVFILCEAFGRRGSPRPSLSEGFAFLFPARVLTFAGILVLYAAAMPWVGFMAASGGFLFVSIAFLWRRHLLWSAAIALISILAVYVIFRLVFQVVLPSGSLWQ